MSRPSSGKKPLENLCYNLWDCIEGWIDDFVRSETLVWDVELWLGPKGGLGTGWRSGSVVSQFHMGMEWVVQSHLRTSPADARSQFCISRGISLSHLAGALGAELTPQRGWWTPYPCPRPSTGRWQVGCQAAAPSLPWSMALAAPAPLLLWQHTAIRQHQAAEFSSLFQEKMLSLKPSRSKTLLPWFCWMTPTSICALIS